MNNVTIIRKKPIPFSPQKLPFFLGTDEKNGERRFKLSYSYEIARLRRLKSTRITLKKNHIKNKFFKKSTGKTPSDFLKSTKK